jgi:hypothetical protein
MEALKGVDEVSSVASPILDAQRRISHEDHQFVVDLPKGTYEHDAPCSLTKAAT